MTLDPLDYAIRGIVILAFVVAFVGIVLWLAFDDLRKGVMP
jgi:hypothetical protein